MAEADVIYIGREAVFVDQAEHLGSTGLIAFGGGVLLDFDYDAGCSVGLCLRQNLLEGGQRLAVGQGDALKVSGRAVLDGLAADGAVVVDEDLSVGGDPQVDLGSVETRILGGSNRRYRVLRPAVFMEASVGYDFRSMDLARGVGNVEDRGAEHCRFRSAEHIDLVGAVIKVFGNSDNCPVFEDLGGAYELLRRFEHNLVVRLKAIAGNGIGASRGDLAIGDIEDVGDLYGRLGQVLGRAGAERGDRGVVEHGVEDACDHDVAVPSALAGGARRVTAHTKPL